MSKYFLLLSLLMVSACGGFENQGVDFESAKNSPLLIPPCADNVIVKQSSEANV